MAGYWPDIVIGCAGWSNFAGLAAPFLGKVLREGKSLRAIAAEPAACPSLTRGRYAYDFLDTAQIGPVVEMHTLGSKFMPPGFHAGGLRFHGMAPLVSHLKELGLIEAVALPQKACSEAGIIRAHSIDSETAELPLSPMLNADPAVKAAQPMKRTGRETPAKISWCFHQ
jgi:tryptophan synthase beta chain